MRRSVLVFAVIATALVAFAGLGLADESRIGVVDLQQVFTKSKKGMDINQKMTQIVNSTKEGLEKKFKELTALKEELERSGNVIKEEVRNEKIKTYKVKEMELQMSEQEAKNKLSNEQRELEQVFAQEIKTVIDSIRVQRNLLLVLSSQTVVSSDRALDVTDDVIRAYDAGAVSKPVGPAPKAAPAPVGPAPKATPKK